MPQTRLPAIMLAADEHNRLTMLANAAMSRSPDTADVLLSELERARIVADNKLPDAVVRMGSTVTYQAENQERSVTLVYPGEADIATGRISILTPIGAALIGLRVGQSIDWKARDGRAHRLTILKVGPRPR